MEIMNGIYLLNNGRYVSTYLIFVKFTLNLVHGLGASFLLFVFSTEPVGIHPEDSGWSLP